MESCPMRKGIYFKRLSSLFLLPGDCSCVKRPLTPCFQCLKSAVCKIMRSAFSSYRKCLELKGHRVFERRPWECGSLCADLLWNRGGKRPPDFGQQPRLHNLSGEVSADVSICTPHTRWYPSSRVRNAPDSASVLKITGFEFGYWITFFSSNLTPAEGKENQNQVNHLTGCIQSCSLE